MAGLLVLLKLAGVSQYLKVDMLVDLERRAGKIADAAGGEAAGFKVESSVTPTRARVVVITDTPEAMLAESQDRALTRAVDAGRG